MAIWQCDIQLIPDTVINGKPNSVPIVVDDDGLDTIVWWQDHQPDTSWPQVIAKEFPPLESWSDEIPMWGEEEGVKFEVFLTGDIVEGISIRVDARHLDQLKIKKMIEVVQNLRCHVYFMETQAIIEPTYDEFNDHLKRSQAVAYVKNPRECLEQIAKERITQQENA